MSFLRFIFIAQTTEHSRLLVDVHRVLPVDPLQQERAPSRLVERDNWLINYQSCSVYICLASFSFLPCRPIYFNYLPLRRQFCKTKCGVYTCSCGVGTTTVWYLDTTSVWYLYSFIWCWWNKSMVSILVGARELCVGDAPLVSSYGSAVRVFVL